MAATATGIPARIDEMVRYSKDKGKAQELMNHCKGSLGVMMYPNEIDFGSELSNK